MADTRQIRTREQVERLLQVLSDRAQGTLGVAARNLQTGEEITWQADRAMLTASTFKFPVLAEVFAQAEAGKLDLDERMPLQADDQVGGSGTLRDFRPGVQPTLRDLATLMIVVSDNSATNMLLDRIGGPAAVNAAMQALGLPSIVVNRRLIFSGAPRGPVAEAAPRDMLRLAVMLAEGSLVSADASREMRAIMAQQHYHDQFPRYLCLLPYAEDNEQPRLLRLLNKTGANGGLRADVGLVQVGDTHLVAFSVVCDTGPDETYRSEHPAAVINGLVGRVLLEYWWPGEWQPDDAVTPSPYVDALLAGANI
jgi:beta-lactamase class A